MLIALIIAAVALYMSYTSITYLVAVPMADWTLANYAIVVMTVVMIGFAIFFGMRAWKLWKKKAATINEQIQKQEQKLRDKKRAVYMEDYDAPSPDDEAEKGDETDEVEEFLAAADEEDDDM